MDTAASGTHQVLPTIRTGRGAQRYNSADVSPEPARAAAAAKMEAASRRRASEPPMSPPDVETGVGLSRTRTDGRVESQSEAGPRSQTHAATPTGLLAVSNTPPGLPLAKARNPTACSARLSTASDDDAAAPSRPLAETSSVTPTSTTTGAAATTMKIPMLPAIGSARGRRSRLHTADPLDIVDELDEGEEMEALKKLLQSQSARLEKRVEEVGTGTSPIPYGPSAASSKYTKQGKRSKKSGQRDGVNRSGPAGSPDGGGRIGAEASPSPHSGEPSPDQRSEDNEPSTASRTTDRKDKRSTRQTNDPLLGSQESDLTALNMTGTQLGPARKMHADTRNASQEAAAAVGAGDVTDCSTLSATSDEDTSRCTSTTSVSEVSFSSLDDEGTIKAKKAAKKKAHEARRAARRRGDARVSLPQGRRDTITPSSAGIQSGARYCLPVAVTATLFREASSTARAQGGNGDNSDTDEDPVQGRAAWEAAGCRESTSVSALASTQRPNGQEGGKGDAGAQDAAQDEDALVMKTIQAMTGLAPSSAAQRQSVQLDPELRKLSEQMARLQARMSRRTSELQRHWVSPQTSTGVIMPPDPSVFAAATDEEVQRKAMSAESFAKNQEQWRRNRLRRSTRGGKGDDVSGVDAKNIATFTPGEQKHKKKKKKNKATKKTNGAVRTSKDGSHGFKSSFRTDTLGQVASIIGTPNRASESLEGSQRRHGAGDSRSSGEWNASVSNVSGGAIFGFASLVHEDAEKRDGAGHTKRRSRGSGDDDDVQGSSTSGSDASSGDSNPYDPSDPRHLEAERDRLMRYDGDDGRVSDMNESSMVSSALGRMSMASCSIARVTDGAVAMMELLANRPDVVIPSPEETAMVRQGDVLSSKHVLKVDLQDALRGREGPTGIIASAPYFRIVPKLNIAGVAQANVSAIHTIIQEFRRAHVDGPIVWVNLREEPLVYINNAAHIVRERVDPLKPIIIPNITGRGIEAIEYKLKQEILQEAASSGGNISTHVETNNGMTEDQWEYVDPASVFTLAEVFKDISKLYNPIESAFARSKNALRVEYFRRPITQNVGPQPEDFDFVLEACLEEPKAIFVFNCQTGRGRASAMMMIASIIRFYQWCVKDISVDVRVLRSTSNKLAFRTIQKLVSLFPDGKLHERRLNILMDMADKVYSMADHINEAFISTDAEHAEIAMMRLQQYAYLLVFSYYCEQRLWNYSTKLSFSDWLTENASLKVLINSVRDKLDDQLRDERIGADDAGDDVEAARIIRRRHGNVLSAGRVLCSMPMPANNAVRQLRQLALDTPIFTCGRMGQKGREELVNEVRSAFPNHRVVHWLSLRAEPMVLINDVSYTLAEYSSHLKGPESMTTMHVSLETIEQLEDRLRRDVLLESQENGGTILLHSMNEQGERTKQYVRVRSVRTSRSMMDGFAERTGVAYHRVPIPFSGQMLATDVDPLLRYLSKTGQDPDDIVILADSEGSTRTTAALNILTLYRASRLSDLRSVQSPSDFVELLRASDADAILPSAHLAGTAELPPGDVPDHPVELLLASTMCQMLTAGTLLQTVDAAILLGGRGRNWNILHMLDFLKRRIGKVGLNKPQCILDALHGLRCYLLVLLTALYLDDAGNYSDEYPFSKWVEDHTEVSHIIDTLPSRGEAALRYISTENLMKADLSRRHGDVLTANFCLKADHFPGCQKKGLRPVVCGAPNFRKVAFINVFGVAIPTRLGVHNILSLLGASNEPMRVYPNERNDEELFLGFAAPRLFDPTFKPEELAKPLRGSVVWVNLREEPLLYVGDKPCVFRDLERPYVNVELTGIQTDKIEQVEMQLMNDVLNEAQQYDNKFLIHDEGNPGELVGRWEKATDSTIKTVRNIYDELASKGIRVRFLRLPVTDEQSPDIEDFDSLVDALLPRITEHLDRRETLSFVFNCQMGRGRTTTGMVLCSLLIGLVTPEYYDELHNLYNPLYKEDESDLSKGEYRVITQLKRVLANGRQAKYRVDLVLEACSRMQNLRTAIEAFAIQLRTPDLTEQGRAHAHHAGVHYLIRYFNIIVFSVYLEECYDRMRKRMRRTFREWMTLHPELTTLCASAALN